MFIKKCISLIIILCFLNACKNLDDNLMGSLDYTDMTEESCVIRGKKINAPLIASPLFAVCDSLFISWDMKAKKNTFFLSNLHSGDMIGSFISHGNGGNEYIAMGPVERIEFKEGCYKSLLYDPIKKEILVWNITESVRLGKDSIESRRHYVKLEPYDQPYSRIWQTSDSTYIGYATSYSLYPNILTKPAYWKMGGHDLKASSCISLIKNTIDNPDCEVFPEDFYTKPGKMRPDNKKIVEGMSWLAQINIFDVETGDIKSYRLKGTPDSGIFNTSMTDATYYYHDCVCDNKHIYALYCGKKRNDFKFEDGFQEVHEYDWDGKMLRRIMLDKPVTFMWLDEPSESIYGYCQKEDAIYCFNLGSI